MIAAGFPEPCSLPADGEASLLERLAALGIAGGSVYDAMVGAAAEAAERVLLTRDRRAVRVYQALGVGYELIA